MVLCQLSDLQGDEKAAPVSRFFGFVFSDCQTMSSTTLLGGESSISGCSNMYL